MDAKQIAEKTLDLAKDASYDQLVASGETILYQRSGSGSTAIFKHGLTLPGK